MTETPRGGCEHKALKALTPTGERLARLVLGRRIHEPLAGLAPSLRSRRKSFATGLARWRTDPHSLFPSLPQSLRSRRRSSRQSIRMFRRFYLTLCPTLPSACFAGLNTDGESWWRFLIHRLSPVASDRCLLRRLGDRKTSSTARAFIHRTTPVASDLCLRRRLRGTQFNVAICGRPRGHRVQTAAWPKAPEPAGPRCRRCGTRSERCFVQTPAAIRRTEPITES